MNPAPDHLDYPHRIVRASAGSGKTYRLTTDYLSLVLRGVSPSTILATTFTLKAAGEILGRVLKRLADAALDESKAAALAAAVKLPRLTRKHCAATLAGLCRQLHRIQICTLDSFFHRIAGSFRTELGIPPRGMVTSEDDPRVMLLRHQAIEAVLSDSDLPTMLELLRRLHHDNARRSVSQAMHTIVTELHEAYLAAPQPELWSTLEVPEPLSQHEIETRIAALEHLPPVNGHWANALQSTMKFLRAADWESFLAKGIPHALLTTGMYRNTQVPQEYRAAFEPLIHHARSEILRLLKDQTIATFDLLQRFHEQDQTLRNKSNLLLFSDLPHMLAAHLGSGSSELMAEVYYRLDARVQHLLLDEQQDTSLEQWQVLLPLAREITDYSDGSRRFMAVGDTKQAIYGWRGGCAEIFDTMAADLRIPPFARDQMHHSYRSSKVVLDVVNAVFTRLEKLAVLREDEEDARDFASAFVPHEAKKDQPGFVELIELPSDSADAENPDSDAEHEDEQAADVPKTRASDGLIAQRIEQTLKEAPCRSVGVLCRSNKKVNAILHALRQRGITASGEGGNPITDDPAVLTVLAALTLAEHPSDSAAAYRVLHSPLAAVLRMKSADSATRRLVSRDIRRQILSPGLAEMLSRWLLALAPACSRSSVNRLTQLVQLAQAYEPMLTLRPSDFVRHVHSVRLEEPALAPVRVMTIHKSKGLEFDVVMLPEMGSSFFMHSAMAVHLVRESPTSPVIEAHRSSNKVTVQLSPQLQRAAQQDRSRKIRDSLCSLYVAMTRARHALHLFLPAVKPPSKSRSSAAGSPTAGTGKLSMAGIVREALQPEIQDFLGTCKAPAPGILLQRGDAQWHAAAASQRPQGKTAACETAPALQSAPALQPRLLEVTGQPRRSWKQQSPSSLGHSRSLRPADLLSLESSASQQRGSLIHAWFQQIEFLDDPAQAAIDPDKLLALARELAPALTPEQVEQYIADFGRMIRQPAVRAALARPAESPSETLELWREQPFVARVQGILYRGIFDRVLLVRRGGLVTQAHVLDYKTDNTLGDEQKLAERVRHYTPQMNAYRSALATMLGLPEAAVRTVLLFVDAGCVREVPA